MHSCHTLQLALPVTQATDQSVWALRLLSKACSTAIYLQSVLEEGSTVCNLMLELIIQLSDQLQHELLENQFRWDAVYQQLVQFAPHCKQSLWRLLCQDFICNLL